MEQINMGGLLTALIIMVFAAAVTFIVAECRKQDVRSVLLSKSRENSGEFEIDIYYADEGAERLQYIDGKSDWIDLRAAERVELKAGDFKLIDLGVAMKIPCGYEAHIVPRSSSFKNWGIIQVNSVGVIDNSYCSADDIWKMPVYATRDAVIEKGDRICQFRVFRNQPRISFNECSKEEMPQEQRGGFGSTGRA